LVSFGSGSESSILGQCKSGSGSSSGIIFLIKNFNLFISRAS
jgi:hypothetical protein